MQSESELGRNVNLRRKKTIANERESFSNDRSSASDSSDSSLVPKKRGKLKKPLRSINSYDSIQTEVNKEKQKKNPARKPRTVRNRKRRPQMHQKATSLKTLKFGCGSAEKVEKRAPRYESSRSVGAESVLREDEEEEVEDPELKMSERMVDRIAALNDGKRTKVGMANCFEDRTALDCIDICLRESENMQEDAVALAIATAVYSLRVDRTHNDAQETRYTFIRGKSDAEKAMMLATDGNFENPKEKKKRKKAEKDAEVRRAVEANDPDSAEQPMWTKELEPDTFDYTFGMKFPAQGSSMQHSDFAEELLDHIESRRIDVRKHRRKKKLMPWKKLIPLDYCPLFMDFERATDNIESDRVDALAMFRARRDESGKVIMLHESSTRKPVLRSCYNDDVDLSLVKQSRDMLSNTLREEPTIWEHYLLDDNPQLYKTGQYLRTGDMTGYVLQERPFYRHFDPDRECADESHEEYSFVEKNADKTLYTFKKPPKGTTLPRLAPLIRVPFNKYANPRNRRIEDFYFDESVEINVPEADTDTADIKKKIEELWEQIEKQNRDREYRSKCCDNSIIASKQGSDEEDDSISSSSNKSVLSQLIARHKKYAEDFERLREELRKQAQSYCSKAAKECMEWTDCLKRAADEERVEDHEIVDWMTSRFLETIGSLKEKSFLDTLEDRLISRFCTKEEPSQGDAEHKESIFDTGHNVVDLYVPENVIFNNIVFFVKRGIHKDVQYIDATYHMKIFKFRVSVEQAHESLRRAERLGVGKTPQEIAILKQKCFRPGRYQGIRDSGQVPKSYQLDPWALEESTVLLTEQFFLCRSYPRLERELLQLRIDIQETARKIPSDSWYFTAVSSKQTNSNSRKSWIERINEAISTFSRRLNRAEEMELKEKRALPKLIQKAVAHQFPFSGRDAAPSTPDEELFMLNDEPRQLSESVCADEEHLNTEDAPPAFFDDEGDDSAFPEEEVHANDEEEEVRSTSIEKSMEDAHDHSNELDEPRTESRNKNGDDHVEEPPKKREKRIKTEVDVKLEAIEQEYFTKSAERNNVMIRDRFKIVEPRTLVRSEDVIFMHQKPISRRVVSEYKFENFIRPGLLRKGQYPHVLLEFRDHDNRVENVFNGILKKSTGISDVCTNTVDDCETNLDVYDEWLATFGGFRLLLEEGDPNFDESVVEQYDDDLASQRNENKENDGTRPNDNCHVYDDSTSSFFLSGNTTKRDRFNDIRPDEYKAIGIDVKNIVPNKDFYSMTKEERAAAVAAEFEAIDALGPKKEDGYVISIMDFSCRVSSYHLNTARMKRVMKSILSNPLLAYDKVLYTRRALLARRRAVERSKLNDSELIDPNEIYYKKLDRSLDASLGQFAEKILEENNPMDITALDPIDVLEAVTYRNLEGLVDAEELPNNCRESSKGGVEESMRQFAAEVRQSDFKVQGLHTFSSVMQCLPRRMGNSGRYVNIANALAVTLYMCNENTLTLVQERSDAMNLNESVNEGEPWMGNFIITNAQDAALFKGNVFGDEGLSCTVEANSQIDKPVPS